MDLLLTAPRLSVRSPLTCGIPFTQGLIEADAHIDIQDPDGSRIPCRASPLVLWPDGSVKWIRVDAVADLRHAEAVHRLTASSTPGAPNVQHTNQLAADGAVKQRVGALDIHAGPVKLSIPHDAHCLITDLSVNGRPALRRGFSGSVRLPDGAILTQGMPEVVRVAADNAVATRIETSGYYVRQHGNTSAVLGYRYRLIVNRIVPEIRVIHTVTNMSSDPRINRIAASSLQLHPYDGPEDAEFQEGNGSVLRQNGPASYELDGKEFHGTASGAARLPGLLTAGLADFGSRFPTCVRVASGLLEIMMLADHSEEGMLFAQGEAQTHEIRVRFGSDAPDPKDMAAILREPPVLVPSPSYMCDTQVFGRLAPATAGPWSALAPAEVAAGPPEATPATDPPHRSLQDEFDARVEAGYQDVLRGRRERCELGYRNYGDTRFEMLPDAWLNAEYDWAHAYYLQYARTADRRFRDLASASAQHVMNTDTIHFAPPPRAHLVGAPYEHCPHHTEGHVDLGHAWVEGMFDAWVLTGDDHAREQAAATADFFLRCTERVAAPRYKDRPGARRPGWGLIALTSAFEYTGDHRYLEGARRIAEICIAEQIPETGAWVYPGGGLDDPRYPVGKTFMVALTLTGLARYHRITGDSRVRVSFLRGVDWAVDWMWDETVGGFRYIDVPFDSFERSPGSSANHMLEPLAYAAEISGNNRYMYVASRSWSAWLTSDTVDMFKPNHIRDTVHYLPVHQDRVAYDGVFPLKSIREPRPAHIRRFYFTDELNGFAVGLFGLMLATTDGGKTWRRIRIDRQHHIYAIHLSENGNGIACGEGPDALVTDDGGAHWRSLTKFDMPLRGASKAYFYDIDMADDDSIYIGGYAVVLRSVDGGAGWSVVWDAVADGRWNKIPQWRSMCRTADGGLWGVGNYGLSASFHPGTDEVSAVPLPMDGALHITRIDPGSVLVCGMDGTLRRSTDAGEQWQTVASTMSASTPSVLWQTDFFEARYGYACGENGRIMASTDAGRTWSVQESGVATPLRAVVALSAQCALAAGDEGVLLRTENGGSEWRRIEDLKCWSYAPHR